MISWGKIPHEGTANNGGRWPHTVRSRIIRGIFTLWSHTNSTGVKHDMTMRTNKEEAGTEILKKKEVGGGGDLTNCCSAYHSLRLKSETSCKNNKRYTDVHVGNYT
jgi:hypothetical protein